jgi:MYXO-CTERM domain-containing protein
VRIGCASSALPETGADAWLETSLAVIGLFMSGLLRRRNPRTAFVRKTGLLLREVH